MLIMILLDALQVMKNSNYYLLLMINQLNYGRSKINNGNVLMARLDLIAQIIQLNHY